MEKDLETKTRQGEKTVAGPYQRLFEIDPRQMSSPVLAQLIAEVRNETSGVTPRAYNRFHNRHNRSR